LRVLRAKVEDQNAIMPEFHEMSFQRSAISNQQTKQTRVDDILTGTASSVPG
jgi:hypothetical protein